LGALYTRKIETLRKYSGAQVASAHGRGGAPRRPSHVLYLKRLQNAIASNVAPKFTQNKIHPKHISFGNKVGLFASIYLPQFLNPSQRRNCLSGHSTYPFLWRNPRRQCSSGWRMSALWFPARN